tara:strand:- start:24 stop:674 length:651 start_codon:yes stop_codon:yes gene_type:complete
MIQSFKEKYNYKTYHINKVNDMRYYCVSEDVNVPSVTSILRKTNDKSINLFQHKFNTDSIEIGNFMHKYLEHYVSKNVDFFDKSENYIIAKKLAELVIDNFIDNIEEIWGTEVSVLYKNAYAGTIDLIGMIDGKLCLVDYKSSYRHKSRVEMEEYFLQLAAYSLAHDWQYDTKIDSIIVFLAIRNGQFEKTSISLDELDTYKLKWLSRLEKFHKGI